MPTPLIQRRWKILPGEPVGDAGDLYTGYDRFGRTEQMRWIKPHSGDSGFDNLVNVQWGYNRASQKTWRKDLLAPASTGQDQHFGYDGLYQVTERQRGLLNVNTTAVGGVPAQVENFSYDETGNWITYRQVNDGVLGIDETRVNNRSNQMTQVDGSSAGISYDKNGNMLTVPTGDGLTGSSRKLEWDAWNRLMKVSDEDDNVLAEYEYDGLSRRTKVKAGGVTRHFYYDDQWRVVEERLDDATTPERQYVWHPTDRWELLFRDRSTVNNGTLDERLYSLKDQLDPVAICDTSGSVVERYDYTAFGISTILNADFTPKEGNVSAFDWNFLFHAEFADAETGWFNYGYRYYVPALGRWLSRDPIGEIMNDNSRSQPDRSESNSHLSTVQPTKLTLFGERILISSKSERTPFRAAYDTLAGIKYKTLLPSKSKITSTEINYDELSLYRFVGNTPSNDLDYLGLKLFDFFEGPGSSLVNRWFRLQVGGGVVLMLIDIGEQIYVCCNLKEGQEAYFRSPSSLMATVVVGMTGYLNGGVIVTHLTKTPNGCEHEYVIIYPHEGT